MGCMLFEVKGLSSMGSMLIEVGDIFVYLFSFKGNNQLLNSQQLSLFGKIQIFTNLQ
jgi:hypothetical protein